MKNEDLRRLISSRFRFSPVFLGNSNFCFDKSFSVKINYSVNVLIISNSDGDPVPEINSLNHIDRGDTE